MPFAAGQRGREIKSCVQTGFIGSNLTPCIYTGCPKRKVNILGGHSIGHSKQKQMYIYMCPIPNDFRDKATSLSGSKIFDKKEILRTVYNTGVYC
jgi:hypothetical protein